ncbi:MAG: thiamine pyrophosphate-binding protein, partial [Candidatus Gastranaerophilales bacterium]|nr:thiamine pyrophosphate-binding protein [Candidatus Gastranaerophilales bacterium]
MIKVSDYIAKRLEEHGIKHVFMISGGGAMHLNDSIGKSKSISYICNHHEQASAIAAEGYSRTSGKPGVVIVTSGPGGTNTLTGVMGQWIDSVPVLYISGQIKQETSIESCREIGLRQLGDQEINVVDIVRPITKFADIIDDPKKVKQLLDKAIHIATQGRPGPVWLDIPLNIQGAMIDEKTLVEYNKKIDEIKFNQDEIDQKISQTVDMLKNSQRPIFIAGHGIRISNSQKLFLDVIEKLKIPVVSTFNGFDLIPSDHPLYVGRIGTLGTRSGNFALQNADLIISIGSRNNIRQVSYDWKFFAGNAKKVVIDIDKSELNKPTLKPDLAINADVKNFLEKLNSEVEKIELPVWSNWINWNLERKKRYPVVLPEYKELKDKINPYYFTETLTKCMKNDDVLVAGNGSACVTAFQAGVVKKDQRMFWNSGCASMGYDLPAAIGACIANDKKDVICLAGDGSLMMNIQELQTVKHYDLPIKLFILNNDGYISIRQTQANFFNGRLTASSRDSGVSMPDFMKIAQAFDLPVV